MTWIDALRAAVSGFEWMALLFFLLINGVYAVLVSAAGIDLLRHARHTHRESRWRVLSSPCAPSIVVIAPAFNESATIADSLNALMALHYPNLEIIIVNDGSTDSTMDVLRQHFDLVPIHRIYRRLLATAPIVGLYRSATFSNLIVVDKLNGRRADAMNAGLNVATGQLVCAIDADTLIEPDALQRMVRPYLNENDVLGVGGTIRVANGSAVRQGRVLDARVPTRPIAAFQIVEYLRAFLFGRLGWNRLGGNLIISGAFGLFPRKTVLAAGGYAHDSIGEDMELVMRLRARAAEEGGPHRIVFVPDPVAWTEVPEDLATLGSQRDRWHRGLMDTLWRYRRIAFRPRYGAMGMLAYPYFVLEMVAPVVEAAGLVGLTIALALGIVNWPFAILFFLAAYGLASALTFVTLVFDELAFHRYHTVRDRLRLCGWALVENLGYRQLTVVWRLRGIVNYFRGRHDWGSMQRRGFHSTRSASAVKGAA